MIYFIFLIFSLFQIAVAEKTTLPLPRYVSLRSNAVNMHVGPGNNYPVDWLYIRQKMPVEIIAEFDTWRQIRDWQGTQGWVHKSLLSGTRTVWILHKVRNMYEKPKTSEKVVARLEAGVICRAIECEKLWCRIEVNSLKGNYKGWIKREFLWGTYPNEKKF